MYIKLENGVPKRYSIERLKVDNPNTSFPKVIPPELLAAWGVFPLHPTSQPSVEHTKNVVEGTPVLDDKGRWVQSWNIVDADPAQVLERQAANIENIRQEKLQRYRDEADPIFFKWQRGEATQQEWLNKVAEIQQQYEL